MNKATKLRALGYAAKVALGAGFVVACGGSDATADDQVSPASDDEIIKGNSACTKGLAKLKEVFPTGDKQWYSHTGPDPKLVADKDVTACCSSLAKGTDPTMSKLASYRNSGCCASDRSHETGAGISACTPWGPPVPPSMDWKNRGIA